jgi:hypothetical protein
MSGEQSVIATYQLSGEGFGTEEEVAAIHSLEKRLAVAIADAGVGEFDGNEFGGGTATLYAYGPDVTALFRVMEPILRDFPLRPASAVLIEGDASDREAREIHVEF